MVFLREMSLNAACMTAVLSRQKFRHVLSPLTTPKAKGREKSCRGGPANGCARAAREMGNGGAPLAKHSLSTKNEVGLLFDMGDRIVGDV